MKSKFRMNSEGRMPTTGALALALFLLLASLSGAVRARDGTITLSDGERVSGSISLSGGRTLRVQSGDKLWSLGLAQVKAVRMKPTKEVMATKWFFPEAGKTEKELVGVPYPIRHLEASVALSDGQVITGHVYTTTVFVSDADSTRRFVLSLRQHGKEGESLESLVYISELLLNDDVPAVADQPGPIAPDASGIAEVSTGPAPGGVAVDADLIVMALPGLFCLPGELKASGDSFSFITLPGNKHVFALRSGDTIRVGWPVGKDDATWASVSAHLGDVKDFFDSRELFGAFRDESDGSIYALILLSRAGKTTQIAGAGRPWRLEVWRWLGREGDERTMLAGRGVFFRGLSEADGAGMPLVMTVTTTAGTASAPGEGAAVSLLVKEVFGEDALPGAGE